MSTKAFTLFKKDDVHFVCCPLCQQVHEYVNPAVEVPAMCQEDKTLTLIYYKPRQIHSSLSGYAYDLDRKKRYYQKKKAENATTAST